MTKKDATITEREQSNRDDSNREFLTDDRRGFLRKSAITTGVAMASSPAVSTLAAACDPSSSYYSEEDYSFAEEDGGQVGGSRCENGFNSGTRMDAAAALVYWDSHEYNDGYWNHHFSSDAHAEHFNEQDCSWQHGPGINQQRWRARDEIDSNEVQPVTNPHLVGAFPAVSEDDGFEFSNTAFTGMSIALSRAWPAAGTVLTAYEIIQALAADLESESPSLWDTGHKWDYGYDLQSCASHFVKFDSEGYSQDANITVEDAFWNDYNYIGFELNAYVAHRTSVDDYETSLSDDGVSEGDVIEPEDGVEVRVESVRSQSTRRAGGERRKVNPAEFKEAYPEQFEERGAPEYRVRLPGITTSTTVTGTVLD